MADDRNDGVSPAYDATLTAGPSDLLDETAPMLDESDVQIGVGDSVGRFVIEERLGAGGMGVVFAARDRDLDRRVAVKVLRATDAREGSSSQEGRARLVREARAMARLSHPNVITVYEVGVVEGDGTAADNQVFVAMELIAGGTLGDWLRAQPRSWRECLPVLVAAGRGLHAAHAAGMIHRDFKPDNVLVGHDGAVCVTDFGLAATPGKTSASSASQAHQPLSHLTRTGARVGTPAYMSPESHRAEIVDARSDQFSFCVTAYEALYRERPFGAESFEQLIANVTEGRVREPPAGVALPGWLARIIRRGLSRDPAQRYPSMQALLDDVARGQRRRQRARVGVAGAVMGGAALVAAALVGGSANRDAQVCTGGAGQLAGVWDDVRRGEVRAALASTDGAPWQAVRTRLDDYAAGWVTMHTDACRATRVRREQSVAVLDLRMACLERRRTELDAVADLLSLGDPAIVGRALDVASSPTELAVCADLTSLRAVVPPPEPAVRARVEAIQVAYDRANMGYKGGRFEQTLPAIEAVLSDARAVGYDPLVAEALLLRGQIQGRLHAGTEAVDSLNAAAELGLSCGHDRVAVQAWAASVYYLTQLERRDEAARATSLARSALARIGGDPIVEAALENNVGVYHWFGDELELAAEHMQRAIALLEQHYGPDHLRLAGSLDNLASVLSEGGKRDEAVAMYRRALSIRELHLGPDHPDVASTLTNLGAELNAAGAFGEALVLLERAVRIKQAALGADNPGVATTLTNVGKSYLELGRYADSAAAYARAARLFEGMEAPRMLRVANILSLAGWSLVLDGRYDEAIAATQRAIDIYVAEGKGDHPNMSSLLRDLAEAEQARGRRKAARAHLARALAIDDKALDKGSAQRAATLGAMGRLELADGHAARAIEWLERAMAVRGAAPDDTVELARDRWGLARALWSRSGQRARALTLARQASQHYERAGEAVAAERAAVRAWRAERE